MKRTSGSAGLNRLTGFFFRFTPVFGLPFRAVVPCWVTNYLELESICPQNGRAVPKRLNRPKNAFFFSKNSLFAHACWASNHEFKLFLLKLPTSWSELLLVRACTAATSCCVFLRTASLIIVIFQELLLRRTRSTSP